MLYIQPFLQLCTGGLLVLIERMGINVQRGGGLAVAEDARYRGHIRAARDHQTGGGVPEGMEAEITTEAETYDITVSGLDRDISILRDDTVTGVLDLEKWMNDNNVEELTPGNYTIPVTFNLSEDIMVENDVNIHIRLKNQDTNN